MPVPIIGQVLSIGEKLIDKLIPDPKQKADALLKLKELEQSGDLAVIAGQNDINKIEAASTNVFIAGWRPAVGWVCAAALAVMLVLGPLLEWGSAAAGRPMKAPVMPTETVMALVTSMLGVAGMRTYEKLKDVEKNR